MSTRHSVCPSNQLKSGQIGRYEVNGKVILIANIENEFFAFDEMCTHEDFSLQYGALKDKCIECSLHGSLFDLKTGKPLEEPATEALNVYPVEVSDEHIYVHFD